MSSTVRKWCIAMKGIAWLFGAAVLFQVLLAGLALFSDSAFWSGHAQFARYFSILPLLLFVASFMAKLPTPLRVQSGALVVVLLLVFATGVFASDIGYVAALHPVFALYLFLRTMNLIREIDGVLKPAAAGGLNHVSAR